MLTMMDVDVDELWTKTVVRIPIIIPGQEIFNFLSSFFKIKNCFIFWRVSLKWITCDGILEKSALLKDVTHAPSTHQSECGGQAIQGTDKEIKQRQYSQEFPNTKGNSLEFLTRGQRFPGDGGGFHLLNGPGVIVRLHSPGRPIILGILTVLLQKKKKINICRRNWNTHPRKVHN